MRLLGNIIWLVLGGWALFLVYLLAAVVFFPMFFPLARLALYSLWPFGQDVVSDSQLERYRQYTNKDYKGSAWSLAGRTFGTLLNVLWILTFGWVLALMHLLALLANLVVFWMIITIPNIVGHWKMMPVAFMPFNKVVVPARVAEDVRDAASRKKLNI